MREPGGLPRPLLELEEKSEGEVGVKEKTWGEDGAPWDDVVNLSFPSESYFLGLPLFFFPNKSKLPWPPPVLPGEVIVSVAAGASATVGAMLVTWGREAPVGCAGDPDTELPGDPKSGVSFSSIKGVWRRGRREEKRV